MCNRTSIGSTTSLLPPNDFFSHPQIYLEITRSYNVKDLFGTFSIDKAVILANCSFEGGLTLEGEFAMLLILDFLEGFPNGLLLLLPMMVSSLKASSKLLFSDILLLFVLSLLFFYSSYGKNCQE